MRSRALLLLTTFVLAVSTWAEPCPVEAPDAYRIRLIITGCPNWLQCPTGTPIGFKLVPNESGFFPPAEYDPGYEIVPCDEVTWDFGDGSPVERFTGIATATHTWTAPGNFTISVTVKNALGSATVKVSRAVGPPVEIVLGPVTASETQGSVNVPIKRLGDTTNQVSALIRTFAEQDSAAPVMRNGMYSVVFAPGETAKTVMLPLSDNKLYDGTRWVSIGLGATGGAVPRSEGLWLTDDEPRPALIPEDVVIREGTGGITLATVTVRLTGPLGSYVNLQGGPIGGTAQWGRDYRYASGMQIKSGETTGKLTLELIADNEPELDEHVIVSLGRYSGYGWSPIDPPDARITIVDDDYALTPVVYTGEVGERLPMVLYPGVRFASEVTVPLRTSDPAVLRVPESVTIPAGALFIEFPVQLIGEGRALVETTVGTNELASRITVRQPRALVASESALTLPPGGTRSFTLALSPPHDEPVTVTLSADDDVVSVPRSVTIPAGGTATVEVRGVGRGSTTIAATARDIGGTAVEADVVTMRRRAAQ